MLRPIYKGPTPEWEYILAVEAREQRLEHTLDDAQIEITQLKADLDKFGGHTAECELNISVPPGYSQEQLDAGDAAVTRITGAVPRPRKCDCGFEKAKERWK